MINVKKAIVVLEKVLAGNMSADEALVEWPTVDEESNEIVIGAWHELTHYAADADIRMKDPEYAEYQREQLTSYVSRLNNEAKDA